MGVLKGFRKISGDSGSFRRSKKIIGEAAFLDFRKVSKRFSRAFQKAARGFRGVFEDALGEVSGGFRSLSRGFKEYQEAPKEFKRSLQWY